MKDIPVPNLIMAVLGTLLLTNTLLSIALGKLDHIAKLLAVIAIKADYIEGRKAAGHDN